MALLTSGLSVQPRQVLQPFALDNTMGLYLPSFDGNTVRRVGGIELLRRMTDAPDDWAQEVFIPIYVRMVRINLPAGASLTNYRIGAIWTVSNLQWEIYD